MLEWTTHFWVNLNKFQRGSTRMDALCSSYGFSEELVKEMVRELPNVYGGYVGWVFVEEFSYFSLIAFSHNRRVILLQLQPLGPQMEFAYPYTLNSEAVNAECERAANSGGGGTLENILSAPSTYVPTPTTGG